MIEKIEASQRFFADHGWLKTHLLFSFANYRDPENTHFGSLRVFNDDIVAAGAGFPEHPHDNMEIVTIVLEGELTHKDNLGNIGILKPGEVQRMSAGSGIIHAEYNNSENPVHLYQIWIFPRSENLPPSYEQKDFSINFSKNTLIPVASGKHQEGAMIMQTDATVYIADLEANTTTSHSLNHNRGLFIYIQNGNLEINGIGFSINDQARIINESEIILKAKENTKCILIDVPLV